MEKTVKCFSTCYNHENEMGIMKRCRTWLINVFTGHIQKSLLLEALKVQGTQEGIINNMMTRKEQYEVINYDFYRDFDKNIARRKLKN